jgi:hypothetical protein
LKFWFQIGRNRTQRDQFNTEKQHANAGRRKNKMLIVSDLIYIAPIFCKAI